MRVKLHVRWEPQEEGMMSAAASFPSVRNQGLIEPVGSQGSSEGCWWLNVARRNTRESAATWNLHTRQSNYFAPTKQ